MLNNCNMDNQPAAIIPFRPFLMRERELFVLREFGDLKYQRDKCEKTFDCRKGERSKKKERSRHE